MTLWQRADARARGRVNTGGVERLQAGAGRIEDPDGSISGPDQTGAEVGQALQHHVER